MPIYYALVLHLWYYLVGGLVWLEPPTPKIPNHIYRNYAMEKSPKNAIANAIANPMINPMECNPIMANLVANHIATNNARVLALDPMGLGMVAFLDPTPTKTTTTKTKNARDIATMGMGSPLAKKIINPQPTIDIKKWAIRENGGDLEYKNREWLVTHPTHANMVLTSMELAHLDLGAFCKLVGIPLPTKLPTKG
jgi:hypothetical protein